MADSGQLSAGTVVGGTYEAVQQIGRGGMGEVWVARHLRLPKQVAIKVLHTRGAPLTDEALARFRREAEIASRLGHPNIVEVHDFNTLPNGDPYLVLELLEGEPLARRLKRGPLPFSEARNVVRQVGSALQAAHGQGVVHRDLKPDNIFLLPSPLGGLRVKVLDFGISKIQDSKTLQTQEAVLVGTPQYMSPEQATGSNKDVGPQSDVFALGAIAYEMLAGEAAFQGESVAQLVFRVAYEKHAPLGPRVATEVAGSAVDAVERALVKDRAQRTPDIATFVAEFTGEPITLTPAAGVPPAPQLALVATPSLELSASLGLADTVAPGGKAAAPAPRAQPAGLATPLAGPAPATPAGAGAGDAPRPPAGSAEPARGRTASSSGHPRTTSSSSSSSRRYSAVWVSAAVVALAVVGSRLLRPAGQGGEGAGEARSGEAVDKVRQLPAAVPDQADPLDPPDPPDPPDPADPPDPPDPPEPPDPPDPPDPPVAGEPAPSPPQERGAGAPPASRPAPPSSPGDEAQVAALEREVSLAGQPPDRRTLEQWYERASAGVKNPHTLDRLKVVVARSLCRQGLQQDYFLWRDKVRAKDLKRQLARECEGQR